MKNCYRKGFRDLCGGVVFRSKDRLPVLLAPLRRRNSLLPFEELPEGRLVGKVELVGNLLVGHLSSDQSIFDLTNQKLVDKVFGRFARLLFADFEEITL